MNLGSIKDLQLAALNRLNAAKASHAAPARPAAPRAPAKSAPRAKGISIQHMTVQKARSNQRLLYDIINFLRDSEKPVSAETIHEVTGHDIKTIPGLLESLQANVKINYEDGWFSYKPPYSVKNIHELLDLINKSPDGIEVSELKDCYKTVDEDIRQLKDKSDIVAILNTDTKYEVAYPNDPRYRIVVADDFKKTWFSVPLPASDVDLEREMKAAGMKVLVEEEDMTPHKRPNKNKKEKRKKILKYTNVHLQNTGIDLSKDYVPDKKPN